MAILPRTHGELRGPGLATDLTNELQLAVDMTGIDYSRCKFSLMIAISHIWRYSKDIEDMKGLVTSDERWPGNFSV